ncbi:hypothetical protein JZU48_03775, partial [bacterium]|nr:hypothetical protein [bacterium]
EILAALESAWTDRAQAARVGANGAKTLERPTWRRYAGEIADFIAQATRPRPPRMADPNPAPSAAAET